MGDYDGDGRAFDTPEEAFAAPTTEDIWNKLKSLGVDLADVRASMSAEEFAAWYDSIINAASLEDIE